MYIGRTTGAGRSAHSPSRRSSQIEHAALIDRASEPYRCAGAFAYNFARGKLRGDPVFRALLERGLLLGLTRILDLGCGHGLLAAWPTAALHCSESGTWPTTSPPTPCPTSTPSLHST